MDLLWEIDSLTPLIGANHQFILQTGFIADSFSPNRHCLLNLPLALFL